MFPKDLCRQEMPFSRSVSTGTAMFPKDLCRQELPFSRSVSTGTVMFRKICVARNCHSADQCRQERASSLKICVARNGEITTNISKTNSSLESRFKLQSFAGHRNTHFDKGSRVFKPNSHTANLTKDLNRNNSFLPHPLNPTGRCQQKSAPGSMKDAGLQPTRPRDRC